MSRPTSINITYYNQWFTDYTAARRKDLPAHDTALREEYDTKATHTLKVQSRAEEIARWLGLSGEDFKIASLCGLFHDLGRFEQAVCFGTMDDRRTGSHGDLSEKAFRRDVPLEGGGLTESSFGLIAAALRYHNLFQLPEGLSDPPLLFAKLTRDADKLDILQFLMDAHTGREKQVFRFVQEKYNIDGDPNPELLAAVLRGENLNASMVRNRLDRMLLELSLIFDLNFGISFQRTLEMRYVEALTDLMGRQFAPVRVYALEYLNNNTTKGG